MDEAAGTSGKVELVSFSHLEIISMIAHLTNALVQSNNAIGALIADNKPTAHDAVIKSGAEVDRILEIMRSKLGPVIVSE